MFSVFFCYLLLTQEVSDFDRRAVVGDGDVVREVRIHESHLILKALFVSALLFIETQTQTTTGMKIF